MIFIVNFNNTRNLQDIKRQYDDYGGTNLDFLLEDFSTGSTRWSVSKNTVPGDIIVFMCAKEARHNLGMATSDIPEDYDADFVTFVKNQKALYKRYSGLILGYGIVESFPENEEGWWMSDIGHLQQFKNAVSIDDFRSFITISRTNSITFLNDSQWERLKWIINQKNPGAFPDAFPPDRADLEEEFEDAVRKASLKSVDELRKIAEKKQSSKKTSVVQSKVYHRDPTIAAYVKKRANGHCQLCGSPAPFKDQNDDPYLECHHIVWLSKGGIDSIDNCVALCPNCHRKMHIVNAEKDVNLLNNSISHENV